MPNDTARRASALIERIQTHCHDRHRASLPFLQAPQDATQALLSELEERIKLENEELFPLFEPSAPARAA